MKALALALIRFYKQAISPHLPPSCRFTPSCSTYTMQAIERFGVVRGTWLGIKRISRCHPFHPGGYDPVPPCACARTHDAPPPENAPTAPSSASDASSSDSHSVE